MLLDYHHQRLSMSSARLLEEKKHSFVRLSTRLDAMSPLKVLGRGYSMTRNQQGSVITNAAQLQCGERITVSLQSGEVDAEIVEIREERI